MYYRNWWIKNKQQVNDSSIRSSRGEYFKGLFFFSKDDNLGVENRVTWLIIQVRGKEIIIKPKHVPPIYIIQYSFPSSKKGFSWDRNGLRTMHRLMCPIPFRIRSYLWLYINAEKRCILKILNNSSLKILYKINVSLPW